ncbi:MAG: hypothetical protein M1817_004912 [Caeruleum heppii]|nr:MAG: hypothetical protein M1817_004912 [Caeruleum heppii]
MAVDPHQRQLGSLGFDPLQYSAAPHFTNPWVSSSTSNTSQFYPSPLASNSASLDALSKQHAPSSTSASVPYSTIPVSAPSISSGSQLSNPFAQQDLLSLSQDMISNNRLSAAPTYGSEHSYSTAPSPTANSYMPTSASYDAMGYVPRPTYAAHQQQQLNGERRLSQPSLPSNSLLDSPVDQRQRQNSLIDLQRAAAPPLSTSRDTFGDALSGARGIMAMSQDATPRNIYGPRGGGLGANDGYGFPTTHSASSSISSASYNPSYYGSVDSSVTDYSSNSDSMDLPSARTLPPPQGFGAGMAGMPPNPQAMMGQFSSKVSMSTQKKHKCKVCDKRFTRPSSLQTHMYSHTGEKPFSCDMDGCGRHFSVVSNLRRHRKVHKGEASASSDTQEDF